MNQPDPLPGSLNLSLRLEGAAGETTLTCSSGGQTIEYAPMAWRDPQLDDTPFPTMNVGEEGVTDYVIRGVTVYVAWDGEIWINTLGTAEYLAMDDGETRMGPRTGIKEGRLTFEE